jgi:amino acid adenylation domain-containing protein
VKPETELIEDQRKMTAREPRGATVLHLVEERSITTPDAVALLGPNGTGQLTYRELDHQANGLARHLRKLGVKADCVVGVYTERTQGSVIAALAILKAGGAYLPLDPALPEQRLAYMLEDARVTAVVSSSALRSRLPQGAWEVLSLDDLNSDRSATADADKRAADVLPEHLAYVIYTSGSKGQPKGVEVTHANLMNLVHWHLRAFQVTNADRASLQAAIGFDAAVWELWPYLAAGASVAIPEETVRNRPEGLRDWMVASGITITFLPTAMAERMLALEWPKKTPLRILLTGAEALRRRPGKEIPFTLVNNYGPTECTVVATSGVVAADPAGSLPSIGRGIDNTKMLILDTQMRPVANGDAGEIYVGGAGVARGYRNNPALDAERFVRNPFNSTNGDRLYRTGDLGRFLPNGEIEFLGRLDEQIKIRGFRVEPGEIANALNSYPGIRGSAVMQLGGENSEKRLAAYLVLEPGAAVTVSGLRQSLSKRLPDYMVPTLFKRLPSLPMTANGKIDYKSLPRQTESSNLPESDFVAPRTLVEQKLAAILGPLLNVERVSVKDNFFLLGGHSLLGTQLITKIKEGFDVELSLLSLFDHPTLEEMSVEVENLILAKMGVSNGGGSTAPQAVVPESR